jgi:hypothetical protein
MPQKASDAFPTDHIDPFNGDWNWKFTRPTVIDAAAMDARFRALLDPVAEANIYPLERMSRDFSAHLRSKGIQVTIDSAGDDEPYVAIFPANRAAHDRRQT